MVRDRLKKRARQQRGSACQLPRATGSLGAGRLARKALRSPALAGLALVTATLTGCAPAAERTARAFPTIVSLNPCSDAILAELTDPAQLLAISHYSHDPAASSMAPERAARFAATGGTAEEVLALAPDVVVADIFLAPATRAALEQAGMRVVTLDIATTLDQNLEQIAQLAQVAEKPARGRALVATLQAAWDAAAYHGTPLDTLLWQEGGLVPGNATLAAAMLEHTGFALHSAARGLGQGAYLPLEQVLADPPQVVLAAGDDRMLTHPAMRMQRGIVYHPFDPSLLYCGGPTIIRALDRLRAIRAEFRPEFRPEDRA